MPNTPILTLACECSDTVAAYLVGEVPPLVERIRKLMYRGTESAQLKQNGTRTKLYEMGADPATSEWLNATESNTIPVHEFGFYRYVLDVGGRSGTTWSALSNKLRMGSLVFKVELGYADWWHKGLDAGVHYVSVEEDLSNLHEMYLWAENNPEAVAQIAEAGRAYAVEARSKQSMDAHLRRVATRMQDTGANCSLSLPPRLHFV